MTDQKPAASTSARHRTDAVSLIFGLLFLGVAGWWAASYYLDWVVDWRLPDVGWLVAGGLILLGLIGIAASLGRDRGAATTTVPETAGPGVDPWPAAPASVEPEPVRLDEPTAEPGVDPWPGAAPMSVDPVPVRPDEPTAELDPPAASDPGGHRPE